jgi:hypothetical protein
MLEVANTLPYYALSINHNNLVFVWLAFSGYSSLLKVRQEPTHKTTSLWVRFASKYDTKQKMLLNNECSSLLCIGHQ